MKLGMTKDAIGWEDWFWFLLSAGCLGCGPAVISIARELWVFGPLCFGSVTLVLLLAGCVAVKDGVERGFHWMRLATFVLTIPAWVYAGLVSVHMVVR
jgi:hypothetical protein